MTNKIKYNGAARLFALALLFVLLFTSCLSLKPGGVKSGKRLFETFYVGAEGTQYFIKPLVFNADNKEELKLDFTFRQKDVNQDSATVNISFYSAENFKAADSLVIKNATETLALKNLSYMFSETTRSGFMARFTSKTKLLEVKKIFNDGYWKINLYKSGKSVAYMASKKTREKVQKLNYELFRLF